MATGIRKAGEFCWVNILTKKPDEAMAFFAGILGWTYFEMPGMGHGIRADGRDIGGIFDLEGPNCPPDLFPTIGVMIKVDDADATCAKIDALGGRSMPAFDIGEQGRMAVCFDPNGAKFDLWQPNRMQGTDADTAHHGSPSWSETLTTDVARAIAFYAELFGWSPVTMPMPGMDYTVFNHDGVGIAGLMAVPEPNIPPHWGTYFTVNDVDDAARIAKDLGATIFVPPMDISGIGRFTGILSPQDVRFYAIQYLRRQAS